MLGEGVVVRILRSLELEGFLWWHVAAHQLTLCELGEGLLMREHSLVALTLQNPFLAPLLRQPRDLLLTGLAVQRASEAFGGAWALHFTAALCRVVALFHDICLRDLPFCVLIHHFVFVLQVV